jgi:N-acetylmuramidase
MRIAILALAACLSVSPVSTPAQQNKTISLVGAAAKAPEGANLRAGPRITSDSIGRIAPNACMHVIADSIAWLKVRECASGREGYVYRLLVSTDADVRIGRRLRDDPTLPRLGLAPRSQVRTSTAQANRRAQRVVEIWNRYGGLLETLSGRLRIEPAVVAAVIAAESEGAGFVGGRPVIRFENHVFWDLWGKDNATIFQRYFCSGFDQCQVKEHAFRPAPDQQWRTFHNQGQALEWAVLDLACRLDRTNAYRATSWGLTQIMGRNYREIGYPSVEAMVASFSNSQTGIHMQIIGFFDFVQGPLQNSPSVAALRTRNWNSFAQLYNGLRTGQGYTAPLAAYYEAASRVLANRAG